MALRHAKVALQVWRKLLRWKSEDSWWQSTDSTTRVVLTSKGRAALAACFSLFLRFPRTPSAIEKGMALTFFQSGSTCPELTSTKRSLMRSLLRAVICFLSSSGEWCCQLSGWMVMIHTLGAVTSWMILFLSTSPISPFFVSRGFIFSRPIVPTAILFSLFRRALSSPLLAKAQACSTRRASAGVAFAFFGLGSGTMRRLTVDICWALSWKPRYRANSWRWCQSRVGSPAGESRWRLATRVVLRAARASASLAWKQGSSSQAAKSGRQGQRASSEPSRYTIGSSATAVISTATAFLHTPYTRIFLEGT